MRKTYAKLAINFTIVILAILLVVFVLPKVLLFFLPFLIGWMIAMIVNPMVRFLESKLKIKRKAGSVVMVVVVIAVVIALLYLLVSKLIREGIDLIQELPAMWISVEQTFARAGANLEIVMRRMPPDVREAIRAWSAELDTFMAGYVEGLTLPTFEAVKNLAGHIPTVIICIIMCLLSSYFFVAERDSVNDWIKMILPKGVQFRIAILKNSIQQAVGGYFKAQLRIEVWVYLITVIGLVFLQVNFSLLIALGIAFLDFLPFFGAGIIMIPWAVICLLSANYKLGIGLLVVWGIGQIVRQVIQPKIMGDSVGFPALPTLFLLYVGFRFGGAIGMIIALPIGILLVNLYKEGVFENTQNSINILVASVNNFRAYDEEDFAQIAEYEERARQKARETFSEDQKE